MKFISKKQDTSKFVEKIFMITQAAKKDNDPSTINATAGCLYDEEGNLFTYKSVFDVESKLSSKTKASYASSPSGNKEYLDVISKYVLEDRVNNNYQLVATPGGTGALYTAMKLTLDSKDTIIIPEIAWGNYDNMAKVLDLNVIKYDVYNLASLYSRIDSIDNDKVFIVINSPCENPLGHAYSYEQWKDIFNKLNNLNKEVILVLDVAYLDYANDNPKEFFELFNHIADNVLILVCFSASKSFSFYGERLGALIVINNDSELVDTFTSVASRFARSVWSNCNNGAMLTIYEVLTNHYDEYIKERDASILMLKNRCDLFAKESSECGLDLYPYKDGFFVTIKVLDDDYKVLLHQRLIDNHIYTIPVNKGLRIALCSIPLSKVKGLVKRIKELM